MRSDIRIISGGQSGADRAALDAALAAGVRCGGWCPAGRLAEDGVIPERYPLTPLPGDQLGGGGYDQRTRRNVLDSDGTVILCFGPPMGGTETARAVALELRRPLLLIDAATTAPSAAAQKIAEFTQAHHLHTLNVAGPRASEQPQIGPYVRAAVSAFLQEQGPKI